jgi:hypothetical protein
MHSLAAVERLSGSAWHPFAVQGVQKGIALVLYLSHICERLVLEISVALKPNILEIAEDEAQDGLT